MDSLDRLVQIRKLGQVTSDFVRLGHVMSVYVRLGNVR
jgi:hypothetical protein